MRVAADRPDHSENVGVALSQNPVTAATAATVTLYSADGLIAVQEEHGGVIADVPKVVDGSAGDDDLTSLTWLQDKNLLKSVHELPKSEFIDDNASDSTLSNSSASSSSSHKSSNQCVNVIPRACYDPQVHVNSKPPFSFSCLIFMAIEDSADKALPVKDIYIWILNHFPYYRNAPTGWKNSVRHNLSLNKCFKKVDKSPNLGKGSLWMVEQRFRPCLIQALQKTPHNQYHKFICNLSNNKKPSENSSCDKDVKNFCPNSEMEAANVPSNEFGAITPQTQASVCAEKNLTDDVDAAATAMLVLKHGAYAFDRKTENVDFVLSDKKDATSTDETIEIKTEPTNCPNDDHNYGYHHYSSKVDSASAGSDTLPNDKESLNSSYWNAVKEDIEEQRKIVEGADALLNLAGITTSNTRKRTSPYDEARNSKQQCTESAPSYRPRLVRKEKNLAVNSKGSISPSDTNQTFAGSVSNKNGGQGKASLNENKKAPKNRPTTTSYRRLRKKLEKKRIRV